MKNDDQSPTTDEVREAIVMEMTDENVLDREFDEGDQLIAFTLARLAMQAGSDAEWEGTESDADPDAIAALGPPREFVRRAVSRYGAYEDTSLFSEADRETVGTEEEVVVEDATCDASELQDLKAAYDSWQVRKHVGWSCEFRIQREIGRGGQGVVYSIECLDKFLDQMALKVFSPGFYGSRRAYEREMKRMADVAAIVFKNGHDNLLRVERFKEHDKCYVMVMELIRGFDLAQLLSPDIVGDPADWLEDWRWLGRIVYGPRGAKRWGLQPGVAVKIVEACLRGLDALHDQEIFHCDIKPSNIMINRYGSVKLIDIGSAFQKNSPSIKPAWTPRYMPPEVLKGGKWTAQSDLASLGYVLIELLSGQPDALVDDSSIESKLLDLPLDSESAGPLDQQTRERLAEVKRKLPSRLPKLIPDEARKSKRLMTLCNRFIDPIPENRFGSAKVAIAGPDGTHEFLSELKFGNLGTYWPQLLECWVTRVKAGQARSSQFTN